MKHLPCRFCLLLAAVSLAGSLLTLPSHAQDEAPPAAPAPEPPRAPAPAPEPQPAPAPAEPAPATSRAVLAAGDDERVIVVETRTPAPEPPLFFSATVDGKVNLGAKQATGQFTLTVDVVQGDAEVLSFPIVGDDDIISVSRIANVEAKAGEGSEGQGAAPPLLSWSVRHEGDQRLLDIRLRAKGDSEPEGEGAERPEPQRHVFTVQTRSKEYTLPHTLAVGHFLSQGAGLTGFSQAVTVTADDAVDHRLRQAQGFLPLAGSDANADPVRFQTTTGGQLVVELVRSGSQPDKASMNDVRLVGQVAADGRSASFTYTGTAVITEAGASIDVLRGDAAIEALPGGDGFTLGLGAADNGGAAVYRLSFEKPGSYPIELNFIARLSKTAGEWTGLDFSVSGGAVVPLELKGLAKDLEFSTAGTSIVPSAAGDESGWIGFVPADGHARVQWKSSRKVGEGRLFFSTTAKIEATVGAGLLRQQHDIEFRLLQGELAQLDLELDGPGEVLAVEGQNIVSWTVVDVPDAGTRRLEVKLSRPITESTQLRVRTQNALEGLPVRLKALRLTPEGAVRHSGYLRLSNRGSVRLEPVGLTGLTQLAPEQFPGEAITARQIFVYRFPAGDHGLEVAADRIQPEVNVSQVSVYRLAKTDRMISSDVELDIREAPIREWDIEVPEDYSVVSVIGASVNDYVTGSEVTDGRRTLKVLFNGEVSGRQLVQLHLEKNEAAAGGEWSLPSLGFPSAKSIRGDIGVVGEAGYRLVPGESENLTEKPLSYFPKAMPGLQQAFRIRESGWSASLTIEVLEKSIQADVFHLYSLTDRSAHASVLFNYLVTGAPVSEWRIAVPTDVDNIGVEGRDVRTWRREEGELIVSLQQPVIGLYQLLLTFEEDLGADGAKPLQLGRTAPVGAQDERGYLQVVSPVQVEIVPRAESPDLLKLDALELPAELRLIANAPALASWQYTGRPFQLELGISWYEPGTTLQQVVDFAEVTTRITPDGELVSEAIYYVRSRGQRTFRLSLPEGTRLWAAAVSGRTVAVRESEDGLRIPLPGSADPNLPIEVRLRIGKASENENHPDLALPVLQVPALKTDWRIVGDEEQVLRATGGTVLPAEQPLPKTGLAWVMENGLGAIFIIVLLVIVGVVAGGARKAANLSGWRRAIAIVAFVVAIVISVNTAAHAHRSMTMPSGLNTLRLSLPATAVGAAIDLSVKTSSLWASKVSSLGILLGLAGIAAAVFGRRRKGDKSPRNRNALYATAVLLVSLGILLQAHSANAFLLLLALGIGLLFLLPHAWRGGRDLYRGTSGKIGSWRESRRSRKDEKSGDGDSAGSDSPTSDGPTPAPTSLLAFAALVGLSFSQGTAMADKGAAAGLPEGFASADTAVHEWQVHLDDQRVHGRVEIQLSGEAGDRFLLLAAPAVMTDFQGEGLRVAKQTLPGRGLSYVAVITADGGDATATLTRKASATFELGVADFTKGFAVPTGPAAMQSLSVAVDRADWEILCPQAVRVEPAADAEATASKATLVLAPTPAATVMLRPKPRDVSMEETQFYVEANQLYLPGPGVVDGHHRLQIRPSQGQVEALTLSVPAGLTVSSVEGPIASWQFDAENGRLQLAIEPAQSQPFELRVGTQRGLDPLPADVSLAPLRVLDADGEVGLVAIAFGADAQPEKADSDALITVNPGDFDAALLQECGGGAVLHRVFRYGGGNDAEGDIQARVAPVAPEVRVSSKQVLSFGDERVVLSVTFAADITRAGLFQLSFPLPEGFEVESLTGDALHHWAELTDENGQRQIVLHLSGKTLGSQSFALTLTGSTPEAEASAEWSVPRFELNEADRHIGDLVVNATTGVRLRSVSRQNVSEVDPRSLGGNSQGALAFRLLQRDWSLVLGVEQLDPWITAEVLHDITLREGQTRTALFVNLEVRNASIRSLRLRLPVLSEDEVNTVRASGAAVSDLIRVSPDDNLWELQFKRRVVGDVQARIEFDRRESRDSGRETLQLAGLPDAGQVSYHFSVRAAGRLELAVAEELPRGWQLADWAAVPAGLREAGTLTAPNLTLRAVAPEQPLEVSVQRHALADALKLRVAGGMLTTLLSPLGDQVTAVDLTAEVIQRGSLTITLPEGGELFSIFVNNESVHSIRQDREWRFHVLPGSDERHANIRFVYSVPGDGLRRIGLTSPPMNVPLENITWRVVAPDGFELTDEDGDLQFRGETRWQLFDRRSYLTKAQQQRDAQAQKAAQLLEQASQYRQAGEQDRALWALNSVVNQYALDAASNEDARVQLENLQTQNAVVGLNTRRQRLFIDNGIDEATALAGGAAATEQLREGAAANPVLQQGDVNFLPQDISQLMRGNTGEDNAALQRIGMRMVQQQRSAEPATQAITLTLPEEGNVYEFVRSVQVAETAPLELTLKFARSDGTSLGRFLALVVLLALFGLGLSIGLRRTEPAAK